VWTAGSRGTQARLLPFPQLYCFRVSEVLFTSILTLFCYVRLSRFTPFTSTSPRFVFLSFPLSQYPEIASGVHSKSPFPAIFPAWCATHTPKMISEYFFLSRLGPLLRSTVPYVRYLRVLTCENFFLTKILAHALPSWRPLAERRFRSKVSPRRHGPLTFPL